MPLRPKSVLRSAVLGFSPTRRFWGTVKGTALERSYLLRRERYSRLCEQLGVQYSRTEVAKAVRRRIADRGYMVQRRKLGTVHTFAYIPSISWHRDLLGDLAELGLVTHFDYTAQGFQLEDLAEPGAKGQSTRHFVANAAMEQLRNANKERRVDWVFVYASGRDLSVDFPRRIRDELGIPTVVMSLDDKHSWKGQWLGEQYSGHCDLGKEFDVAWTSATVACGWYLAEGGRPIYLPEGFSKFTYYPLRLKSRPQVSFVGAAYGFRPDVIQTLRTARIDVRTYGTGWPQGGWVSDPNRIFNESLINLGIGGVGYSPRLQNLKGRDFEVIGAGGGVYLTSYNADLAKHFTLGKEMVCYGSPIELVEQVRYLLGNPEEAREIANAGYARAMREHRWLHRFVEMCAEIGILEWDFSASLACGGSVQSIT